MEDMIYLGDFSQTTATNQFPRQTENMDLNLADSLLELDAEDLTEIYHMVSEWEFNFGSLEGSDGEEADPLVQIDKASLLFGSSSHSNTEHKPNIASLNSPTQTLDRVPSYYTALAPSGSTPWIQPPAQQVINKLPAYITDLASSDAAEGGPRPSKKKLNLAEYRTRREKQLQQQQQQQTGNLVKVKEELVEPVESEISIKEEEATLQVETEVNQIKSEPQTTEVETNRESSNCSRRRETSRVRRKSSRSPTRSYSSSQSSRSSRSPSPAPARRRQRSSSRSSYSSRSRSRSSSYGSRRRRSSRSRSRSYRRNRSYSRRSPSPRYRYSDRRRVSNKYRDAERQRQIEERRVIYVGKIAEGSTRADLRRRFEIFGPVIDISLHFRERGDNYGFVTFAYKVDAYEAVEHGNDDPTLPKYDLSFGGRRAFCKETYADLDAVDGDGRSKANDVDFETLLRAVQAQLHRRPCS